MNPTPQWPSACKFSQKSDSGIFSLVQIYRGRNFPFIFMDFPVSYFLVRFIYNFRWLLNLRDEIMNPRINVCVFA